MAASKSGGNLRTIPEGKTQVNFNLDNSTLEKVKTLAIILSGEKKISNSDIYNTAVKSFVELYEKKHGKIKPLPKVKGFGGL